MTPSSPGKPGKGRGHHFISSLNKHPESRLSVGHHPCVLQVKTAVGLAVLHGEAVCHADDAALAEEQLSGFFWGEVLLQLFVEKRDLLSGGTSVEDAAVLSSSALPKL